MHAIQARFVPEMHAYDPDEIENNAVLQPDTRVPLLGALLVAEGLITQEQLNACLLVQAQDHPDIPIGQILVSCGYISPADLNQALMLQQQFESSILDTLEAHALPPSDMTALVLHEQDAELICTALNRLGVAALPVHNWAHLQSAWQAQHPDLIFLSIAAIPDGAIFPKATTLVQMLPASLASDDLSQLLPWARTLIAQFVGSLRAQRAQQSAATALRQREEELNLLVTMSRRITTAGSPHDALVQLMQLIRELLSVEAATLYRFDKAAHALVFEVVLGPNQASLQHQRLPADRGIAGWVVRHGEPLLIPDVRRDTRFEGMFDHRSGFRTQSVLCVPLIAMGELRGVIQLINKIDGEFNERDLQLLRILAVVGALAEAVETRAFERDLGR